MNNNLTLKFNMIKQITFEVRMKKEFSIYSKLRFIIQLFCVRREIRDVVAKIFAKKGSKIEILKFDLAVCCISTCLGNNTSLKEKHMSASWNLENT